MKKDLAVDRTSSKKKKSSEILPCRQLDMEADKKKRKRKMKNLLEMIPCHIVSPTNCVLSWAHNLVSNCSKLAN